MKAKVFERSLMSVSPMDSDGDFEFRMSGEYTYVDKNDAVELARWILKQVEPKTSKENGEKE